MSFLNGKQVIMAVNFIRIYVNRARMNVNFIRMNVNLIRILVKKARMNVNFESKKVNQIRMKVNLKRKRVSVIIVSDNPPILTDKKDPLRNNNLQAHFAGAKRQQHLQKELVLRALISSSSIIHQHTETENMYTEKTKRLTWRSANRGLNASGAILLSSSFVLSISFCTKFGL